MTEKCKANKERFIQICRENIHRDGVERLLDWLELTDFFTAPASTRFHLSREGGLCEHSLNVYDNTVKLCDTYFKEGEYTNETIALVSLFHDLCKANFYEVYYKNQKNEETGQWERVPAYRINEVFPLGHSQKSVILLQNFFKLEIVEVYAIMAHMGGYDAAVKGGDYYVSTIMEKCPLAVIVHCADLISTKLFEKE